MKGVYFNLLLVFSILFSFVACDEGEVEDLRYGHFTNIFDVKDYGNSNFVYFAPAYSDTVYAVSRSDADASGVQFNIGDRVFMKMGYELDVYSSLPPKMNVAEVVSKVAFSPMRSKSGFVPEAYNSLITGNWISFNDMDSEVHESTFVWADVATQNFCITYDKELNCEAELVLDSLRNKTLYFRLYANLEKKEWNDNETFVNAYYPDKVCKILSFKIDWDFIKSELTALEQAELEKCDSLMSNIKYVREGCKKDDKGLYVPMSEGVFSGGYNTIDKIPNKLYKKN